MSNSGTESQFNQVDLDQQILDTPSINDNPNGMNNQEGESQNLTNIVESEENKIHIDNENLNEKDPKEILCPDLNEEAPDSLNDVFDKTEEKEKAINDSQGNNHIQDFENVNDTDIYEEELKEISNVIEDNFDEEESKEFFYNSNKEEEEFIDFNNTNFGKEEELKDLRNTNISVEDSKDQINRFEEEEDINQCPTKNVFEEEEDHFSNLDDLVLMIESGLEYSFDSEYDLINDIFDENRPKIIVRRNYNDDLDKKSIKSMRSMRSTRSSRSIKKRHISKIQKYNVTRPFVKTAHFDTTKKPDDEEFKDEQLPIRYNGSRGFLKRQFKSNDHRVELRSQEPTERGFDPPLYTKEQSSKNTKSYKDMNIRYLYKSTKKSPQIQANSYLEDLFQQSVKKPPIIVEEPLPEMYKVNQTSEDIAKQKNQELIELIVGKEKTIPEIKFVSIMRRFNISNTPEPKEPFAPRPLICKIKDIVKLEDNRFDNIKLKELLINAFIGEIMDEISNELRPPVLAALSNIRPSYFMPRKSTQNSASKKSPKNTTKNVQTKQQSEKTPDKNIKSKNIGDSASNKKLGNDDDYSTDDEFINVPNQKTKSKTPQKKSNPLLAQKKGNGQLSKTVKIQKEQKSQTPKPVEKESTGKQQHRRKKNKNEDQNNQLEPDLNNIGLESNDPPEKEQKSSKKRVRPKQPTSRGAKYFPGFYDNLDFYVNKSPSNH